MSLFRKKNRYFDRQIVFFHCPKTAGCRIREIVMENVGENVFIFSAPHEISLLNDSDIAKFRAVMGHVGCGFYNRITSPSVTLTFLRNPVDRVLSLYNYWKHSDAMIGDPGPVLARQMSIEDFVASDNGIVEATIKSMMTWFFYFDYSFWARHKFAHVSQSEILKEAKNRLDSIDFVGVQERFAEGAACFQDMMGWDVTEDRTVNSGPIRNSNRNTISDDLRRKIETAVEMDMELYDYGLKLANRFLS